MSRIASLRPVPAAAAAVVVLLLATLAAPATSAPPAGAPEAERSLRVLDEDEVRRYLQVFDQLVDLGLDAGPMVDAAGRGGAAGQVAAVRYSERMQAVIEGGGFTLESFTGVHWNAMLAYAAAEMAAHRSEMDRMKQEQAARLEAMRSELPPEQYAQLAGAMAGMTAMDPFADVPAENIALIERHRAELERIVARADRER